MVVHSGLDLGLQSTARPVVGVPWQMSKFGGARFRESCEVLRRAEGWTGDDVPMTGMGPEEIPWLIARAVDVPLRADPVAPPRLAYGGLDVASDAGRDDCYTAV
jgi:hypothetical protein